MQGYEPFEGTIGRTLADSVPWWPTPSHPPENAPNVVVMLIDDLGFSHLGCFGSDLVTPNIDALAANGLRYSNFHVTPLCSPTRAALLTGRNHHSVGMRGISNWSSGFPSMRGHVSNHATTMAEVLRDGGYTTFAIGKWHLVSMENSSSAGPFDQWPLQRGVDRFYGFLDGETDQFAPDLVYDNHRVDPPRTFKEGYHLSEDLVDKAIEFIHDTKSIRPDRPFFTYFAFGATHAPHQAPAPYLAKHRGRYDEGWDVARARWFARQQELGLLAATTELAPRNEGVEPWDSLPENHQRLASRLQEAYAAFLEHTDAQIGRFMDELQTMGELDNTLVLLMSDNGASQEGGPFGILHEMKYFNFILESPDEAVTRLDDIGGPHSHSNYPWGWAQAGNTPFKWYKQNTHEGGVHVPLIIHWPRGIEAKGEIRQQFHYVTDVAPTVYEAAGVVAPEVYRGLSQMPIAGTSMRYSFEDVDAESEKLSQYFEMSGHRAMYHEGWKAVTRHVHGASFDDDHWELYHVEIDPSECHDLSSVRADKLDELIERWWHDAEIYGALPLDDRGIELFGARFRDHSPHPTNRHYTYLPPISPVPPQAAAGIGGRSWDLDARVDRVGGSGGVIMATGNENAGLSLFIYDDHLVFDYNIFDDHHVVISSVKVPVGESTVGLQFRRGQSDAEVTLMLNGADVGTKHLPFLMRIISSSGMSIGSDHASPVSTYYDDEFPFEGYLKRVDIQLISQHFGEEQATAAREGMARQ
ncbi:MAG TPA: arylsulfatase [Acidimicrobiales bacterium]|nr:arylsulfatase [Acidimicrobiales bacterium]